MKSNLFEIFNNHFAEYEKRGVIDTDQFIDETIIPELIVCEYDKESFIRDFYVRPKLDVMLNNKDCYSYAKNKFISLNRADIGELAKMDEHFSKQIAARTSTLKRIREREETRGQFEMQFDADGNCTGYEEKQGIDDLIAKAVSE